MPRQGWLADVARDAGLAVVEVDGWRERGNPSFAPGGVVEHHTAGARNGDIPSLGVLVHGRSDLAGPLCNYGMARSGTVYVIAAGRANHAGAGGWQGMVGNSSVVGVEYENAGGAGDPWPTVQLEAGVVLTAAVMERLERDTKYVAEHKEWAPSRKVDRHTITGAWWREQVGAARNQPKGEGAVYVLLTSANNTPATSVTIPVTKTGEVVLAVDFGDATVRVAIGRSDAWEVREVKVPHGRHIRLPIKAGAGAHLVNLIHRNGPNVGVIVT